MTEYIEMVLNYKATKNVAILNELTENNLHSVRELCEQGKFNEAIKWLKERN